jgi:hypothetical protein
MKRSDFKVLESPADGMWRVFYFKKGRGWRLNVWPQKWATKEGAQSAIDELFDPEVDSHESV